MLSLISFFVYCCSPLFHVLFLRFPFPSLRLGTEAVDKSTLSQRGERLRNGIVASTGSCCQSPVGHQRRLAFLLPAAGLPDQEEENSQLCVLEGRQELIQ